MEYRNEDGKLVIKLTGSVNSTNANALGAELTELVASEGARAVVIDASELEYISSAGLRVLMKLRKGVDSLEVIEVSSDVYEVFDMTGFTQLMDVRRAMRTISVEGCECIGRGGNGAIYRLDPETIVKAYYSSVITLDQIQASRLSAQKLMAYGIPVAIAFDVVKVEGGYGLVYELLDCKTVGQLIHEDPSCAEHWGQEAAKVAKLLHTTEVPEGTFPDARESGHQWVEVAKGVLTDEQQERLHRIYDTMPAGNTLVHGDFHTGNMMVQNGEIILIDTDDTAQGDPIIDLASMALVFEFIQTDAQAMSTLGMTAEEARSFFAAFVRAYYGTDDEGLLKRYEMQRKPHAMVKLLYGMCKSSTIPQEVKDAHIPQMRAGLFQLLDAMGM